MTNARTKVVFGGMIDQDLDVMSKEMYVGELDPGPSCNRMSLYAADVRHGRPLAYSAAERFACHFSSVLNPMRRDGGTGSGLIS
jgi:hypothetical protein